MHSSKYMFINYSNRNFPVYVSVQSNREHLVPPHFHEDIEILKVTCEQVQIYVGTKHLQCYKGDIIFFPPNTLHQVISGSENAEITAISYNDHLLKTSIDYSLKRGEFRLFTKDSVVYEKINAIFSEIIHLSQHKSITYEIEVTACLLQLTAILIKENIVLIPLDTQNSTRLKPVLNYIDEHLDSPIRIEDLTKILNVSKEHLIRLFKSTLGKTPIAYMIDLKLQKAMLMLAEDTYSITQISESLSFSNPAHFSKVFKQRLNMTPYQYRIRVKQPPENKKTV